MFQIIEKIIGKRHVINMSTFCILLKVFKSFVLTPSGNLVFQGWFCDCNMLKKFETYSFINTQSKYFEKMTTNGRKLNILVFCETRILLSNTKSDWCIIRLFKIEHPCPSQVQILVKDSSCNLLKTQEKATSKSKAEVGRFIIVWSSPQINKVKPTITFQIKL